MAVTSLKVISGTYNASEKQQPVICTGVGAPEAEDSLVTDTEAYPIGSEYLDTDGSVFYKRFFANGEVEDFVVINATS